ncbi:MAG: DUF2784 domain-containing protein [Desulfobacterales bacterium]|jgi:hypothetical protein|nr:DUF2784 domain-containing protein [Desulfobulbaceae bacterium]MDX2434127.1 DUF2784 domain-containing protein [Desulfobacterales bacterium]
MLYNSLADLIVVLHSLFVLFVMLGGFLVLWKSSVAWCHIPAVFWAASIEFFGWICPLTPLENMLREKGGAAGYDTGFVEHYIVPILYPASLTRQVQINFGIIVLSINIGLYFFVLHSLRKTERKQE